MGSARFGIPLEEYLKVLKGRDAKKIEAICRSNRLGRLEFYNALIKEFERIIAKTKDEATRKN